MPSNEERKFYVFTHYRDDMTSTVHIVRDHTAAQPTSLCSSRIKVISLGSLRGPYTLKELYQRLPYGRCKRCLKSVEKKAK